MQIFIARPDKSHGPYSLDEVNAYLASGHLTSQDMAWFAGCAGWMPLPQVPGVQMPAGSASPPAPPAFAPQPQLAPQPGPAPQFAVTEAERTLFEISPSLTPDIAGTVLTCGLWLPVLVVRGLANQGIKYKLTTQRLLLTTGLVSRRVEEVELYRIQDVTMSQSALGRMLGFGTVVVHVNDASTPRLVLQGVSNPMKIKEQIRDSFRTARRTEGVRSIEYGAPR